MPPQHLYKIISVEQWDASHNAPYVKLSAMDDEFVHLSTEDQLDKIQDKFWKDVKEYLILQLETSKLQGKLILEVNPGGKNLYYHLYEGKIPKLAIQDCRVIKRGQS